MKLSENIESALHLCHLLATLPRGKGLPAGRLAEFHSLPPAAIAKVMQSLMAAGVVQGQTGRAGGYRLSRSPAAISALDVVLAVSGRKPMFQCREIRRRGPCADRPSAYRDRCGIARLMDEAEAAWRARLQDTTLADLVRETEPKISARSRQAYGAWLERVLP
jgi:Rrf2 family protein